MDIAVVVNLNARRGSERFAAWARKVLPNSKVVATRSVDDVNRFVDDTMKGCILDLYRSAVERAYRFYSYGDAMLLPGRM